MEYGILLALFSYAAVKDLDSRLLAASLVSEACHVLPLLHRFQVTPEASMARYCSQCRRGPACYFAPDSIGSAPAPSAVGRCLH